MHGSVIKLVAVAPSGPSCSGAAASSSAASSNLLMATAGKTSDLLDVFEEHCSWLFEEHCSCMLTAKWLQFLVATVSVFIVATVAVVLQSGGPQEKANNNIGYSRGGPRERGAAALNMKLE